MREAFSSLGELMGCYRFMKLNVTSQASPLPHKIQDCKTGEWYQMPRHFNAWASRASKEDKFAFIADVENFTKHYEKHQGGYRPIGREFILHIFHLKFCKDSARYRSYGHMALAMKNRRLSGETHIPKRLMNRRTLFFIADAMAEKMEDYYIAKGMINR